MASAKQIAMEISRDRKMPYINGYDHPLIMAGKKLNFYYSNYDGNSTIYYLGQGTIGLEIVEQCEGADAVIIPGK